MDYMNNEGIRRRLYPSILNDMNGVDPSIPDTMESQQQQQNSSLSSHFSYYQAPPPPTSSSHVSRRNSIASTGTTSSTVSSVIGNGHMTEDEQEQRRRSIKSIMCDTKLSQKEKSRKIQSLMDGRAQQQSSSSNVNGGTVLLGSVHNRRGSASSYCSSASSVYASSMAHAAAIAAAETINYVDYEASFQTYSNSSSQSGNDYSKITPTIETQHVIANQGNLGSYKQYHGRSKSLQDWNDTDRPTAAAQTTVFGNQIQQVSRLMEQSRPACEHYERNCSIISPCCGLAFGCRICHDECPVLPPPLVFKRRFSVNNATPNSNNINTIPSTPHIPGCNYDAMAGETTQINHMNKLGRRRSMPVELTTDHTSEGDHHLIDRFAIREVICRHCYTRQSSKSNNCMNCSIAFGRYHCNICNLWMSDIESPYHCDECGFCRVGGRENFRHCTDCGMCIDTLLFDDHNCKSGKYMSDCPICQEDLFSSRFASHEMPCGHAIHWHCFTELTSYDTRCPVCKKTADSPESMETTWNAIATGIAMQPVPPEMARMVNILCNDCETTHHNQRWHFLGVRCKHCRSFNTIVEQIVMQGHDAAKYLDRIDRSTITRRIPTDISLPMQILGTTISQSDEADLTNDDSSDDSMNDDDDTQETTFDDIEASDQMDI